jgi:hypothetical protein
MNRDLGSRSEDVKSPSLITRNSTLRHKRRMFHENENLWYKYWQDQTNYDFHQYCKENIISTLHQTIFPVFLFHVEMIREVIPR